jgi:hypothetical protein
MNDTAKRDLDRYRQAGSDISMMLILLPHHFLLARGNYDPDFNDNNPELTNAGKEAIDSLKRYKELLFKQAHRDFPEEEFQEFKIDLDNHPGDYPPSFKVEK